MAICKFFAQGFCRYGDHCFYQHPNGGLSTSFSGGARSNPFKLDNRFSVLSGGNDNTEQMLADQFSTICEEMRNWDRSGMWLFSSFYTAKDATCKLPGLEDYSPEELRHKAYSENPKPHLQLNYKAEERQLINDVKMKIAALKNPDAATKQQLMEFLRKASRGGNNASTTGSGSSVFGSSTAVSTLPSSPTSAATSKTAEETLALIANEVNTWELSGMWLLSEYCSSKESPTIPGFKDISPDELRFEAYSENPKPNLQLNYKAKERELINEAKMRIGQLKSPDPSTKQQLITFLAQTSIKDSAPAATSGGGGGLFGGSTSNMEKSVFGGTQSPTSLFAGASTQNAFGTGSGSSSTLFGNSTFGGTNNSSGLFGMAAASGTTTFAQSSSELFGKSSSNPSTGIFGNSSTQNVLGASAPSNSTSPFGNTSGDGLFGKTSANDTGLFGQSSTQSTPTGLFGKPVDVSTTGTSLFGKPAPVSLFGGSSATGSVFGDTSTSVGAGSSQASDQSFTKSLPLYTPLNELTEEERAQFEAAKFILGRVPTRPPAKEHV